MEDCGFWFCVESYRLNAVPVKVCYPIYQWTTVLIFWRSNKHFLHLMQTQSTDKLNSSCETDKTAFVFQSRLCYYARMSTGGKMLSTVWTSHDCICSYCKMTGWSSLHWLHHHAFEDIGEASTIYRGRTQVIKETGMTMKLIEHIFW